jgi:hypothetical protein
MKRLILRKLVSEKMILFLSRRSASLGIAVEPWQWAWNSHLKNGISFVGEGHVFQGKLQG